MIAGEVGRTVTEDVADDNWFVSDSPQTVVPAEQARKLDFKFAFWGAGGDEHAEEQRTGGFALAGEDAKGSSDDMEELVLTEPCSASHACTSGWQIVGLYSHAANNSRCR